MSVAAPAICVAVENVPATFGADPEGIGGRAVCGIYRIPARIFGSRVGNVRVVSPLVVSRLLVIRPAVIRAPTYGFSSSGLSPEGPPP
jgi:hypothetical protein